MLGGSFGLAFGGTGHIRVHGQSRNKSLGRSSLPPRSIQTGPSFKLQVRKKGLAPNFQYKWSFQSSPCHVSMCLGKNDGH